jgi:hypothetical protein
MRTFKTAMLTLSLLALPMIALPNLAEAGYMVPKYAKTATAYKAKQGKKMRAKSLAKMKVRTAKFNKAKLNKTRTSIKPIVKPAPIRTSIKSSTTRAYISRSLHKQANKNYYLNGKRVRVTNVKINNNRISYKGGEKYVGFTARVKQAGGSSYNANGFVRQGFAGQPKGQDRVRIVSGTPTFGVIVR